MQNAAEEDIVQRLMLYFSRMYFSQLHREEKYKTLYPVIVVAITSNIPAFKDKDGYWSHHLLLDKKSHEQDIKDIELVLVELDKFEKDEDNLENNVDRWLYFFKVIGTAKEIPAPLRHGEFKQACELLRHMRLSDEERLQYDLSEVKAMSMENNAEKLVAGAIKRAEAKGELKKARTVAKNLLADNMPLEKIASLTGLSEDEIKKL
jgi:predicted transposase/invertase (TIGR01784 family)